MDEEELTARIVDFLRDIGLPVRFDVVEGPTVLPGITIECGVLVADRSKMHYPGDLLHEAGHLAVMPADQRGTVVRDAGADPGWEMAAIAWSYAALCHLGLDPGVVFHEGGYRGGARSLIENFSEGRSIGAPLLQWLGLTADAAGARELGIAPYPSMRRWLV